MYHKGPLSALNISPSLSAQGGGASVPTEFTTPAEVTVAAVAEIIEKMKGSLGNLGRTLDSLGEQGVKTSQAGGDDEVALQIISVRKQMESADAKQEAQISDVEDLLQKVLQQDVLDHLTTLIENGILEEIDTIVQTQVAAEIPQIIPQHLQDELRKHKNELEKVQRDLFNSESRRANFALRSHRLHEKVHPLYNTNGSISECFPSTLGEMFAISAETAKRLLREYGLEGSSESHEKNVNIFLLFCGLQYLLTVSKESGVLLPSRIHPEGSSNGGQD
ncbi:hypothetical protein BD311DRAFT_751910 [Dichomitus squalens]|uniref:Uncharacterized protein n=1 Tax=Dichomitus squalens TaxID=114155 RepID=A0A4Q9MVD5_9APHY|nr:hypothetical protein BD311DRAFT_751910 [Dichomitus squalens]